jgi:hypothetical protein
MAELYLNLLSSDKDHKKSPKNYKNTVYLCLKWKKNTC